MEAESQVAKLQTSLDNILKERVHGAFLLFSLLYLRMTSNSQDLLFLKFGDLDPSSADFFLQEERMKQLRAGYEAQYRVSYSEQRLRCSVFSFSCCAGDAGSN